DPRLSIMVALEIGQQNTDPPHSIRLLRARGERPSDHCAAKNADELAPPHSITSSAREISVCGKARPIARAVLRLTDSVNLAGAGTGSPRGREWRKMRST